MTANRPWDFSIRVAGWKTRECEGLADFVLPAARDLQRREVAGRIDRAQKHDVRIIAFRAPAWVNQDQSACRGRSRALPMRKDGFRSFARVAPDLPACDHQILFNISAATDKRLAASHRANIN